MTSDGPGPIEQCLAAAWHTAREFARWVPMGLPLGLVTACSYPLDDFRRAEPPDAGADLPAALRALIEPCLEGTPLDCWQCCARVFASEYGAFQGSVKPCVCRTQTCEASCTSYCDEGEGAEGEPTSACAQCAISAIDASDGCQEDALVSSAQHYRFVRCVAACPQKP